MARTKDKQEQKAALQKFREKQRALLESQMPISKLALTALFNRLDEKLGVEECDHTLKHTSAFLDERTLSKSLVLDWAAERGRLRLRSAGQCRKRL